MAGEIDAVEKVVWTYLDGLYEGDTAKLGKAFHEVSHLYSVSDGGVADLPREIGGRAPEIDDLYGPFPSLADGLEAFRRHFLRRLVRDTHGDAAEAARRAGIPVEELRAALADEAR